MNLSQYEDVKTVLDRALASGGASYVLPTRAKAVEWRHRAYRFRTALREAGPTPYDEVRIRLSAGSSTCVIEIGPRQVEGEIIAGQPAAVVEEDALVNFVKGLRHGS